MALEGGELLSTLTVGNTDDGGAGSLREAIARANADERAGQRQLRYGWRRPRPVYWELVTVP
jgi:hypothetical protein